MSLLPEKIGGCSGSVSGYPASIQNINVIIFKIILWIIESWRILYIYIYILIE
jgi:hypothetical protein